MRLDIELDPGVSAETAQEAILMSRYWEAQEGEKVIMTKYGIDIRVWWWTVPDRGLSLRVGWAEA